MNSESHQNPMSAVFYKASVKLVMKLKKDFKTLEDAKYIYSHIQSFNFFNKFINNHFSNSMDEAVLYVSHLFSRYFISF